MNALDRLHAALVELCQHLNSFDSTFRLHEMPLHALMSSVHEDECDPIAFLARHLQQDLTVHYHQLLTFDGMSREASVALQDMMVDSNISMEDVSVSQHVHPRLHAQAQPQPQPQSLSPYHPHAAQQPETAQGAMHPGHRGSGVAPISTVGALVAGSTHPHRPQQMPPMMMLQPKLAHSDAGLMFAAPTASAGAAGGGGRLSSSSSSTTTPPPPPLAFHAGGPAAAATTNMGSGSSVASALVQLGIITSPGMQPHFVQPPASAVLAIPATRKSVGRSLVTDEELQRAIEDYRRERRRQALLRARAKVEEGGGGGGGVDDDDGALDVMGEMSPIGLSGSSILSMEQRVGKDSKTRLTAYAAAILSHWLELHVLDPYPDQQEKDILCSQTGLNPKQLTNWLVNNRKRKWAPMFKYLVDHKLVETTEESSEKFRELLTSADISSLTDIRKRLSGNFGNSPSNKSSTLAAMNGSGSCGTAVKESESGAAPENGSPPPALVPAAAAPATSASSAAQAGASTVDQSSSSSSSDGRLGDPPPKGRRQAGRDDDAGGSAAVAGREATVATLMVGGDLVDHGSSGNGSKGSATNGLSMGDAASIPFGSVPAASDTS